MTTTNDHFGARTPIETPYGTKHYYRLDALAAFGDVRKLPISIRVLLESCLRNYDDFIVTEEHLKALMNYDAKNVGENEIPFMPGRVVLQDFTGVPCVVDLAAMRAAMARLGGDPKKVNPLVPCDLVIDHSVQVDAFASGTALTINGQKEFERNMERYEFLKWGQSAFSNFSVVPPATGIVHQVNLEYLAKVVWEKDGVLYPDSLVGTDSHTTMINGAGVVGWGVGGIEAEAVMLGQPIYMLIPEVVGVKLIGKLPEGVNATDLVLRATEVLRKHGVVNKFVEFFGPGLSEMPLANRATIANMAPEYGATIGFFPVDEQTLAYLRLSGRAEGLIKTIELYAKQNGFWREDETGPNASRVVYSSELLLDLSTIEPSLAGPARPQDRIALSNMQPSWRRDLGKIYNKGAQAATPNATTSTAVDGVHVRDLEGNEFQLKHGAIVIAAITSCTNTSNPNVMIEAGLVAQKAAALGLTRKPWVKTSLAPGSKVVTEYLNDAGLMKPLEALGFYLVGYGCTTCIGNSGPLADHIGAAIKEGDLAVASVLSGNRNFEARVHQDVKANYLASPPLCVAYAIAGTVDIDLQHDPLGVSSDGRPIYLKDIWPTQTEVAETVKRFVTRAQFEKEYADVFKGSSEWQEIATGGGEMYAWAAKSTYIQEPPFFVDMTREAGTITAITGARCLAKLGDSVTTDHISPAGDIKRDGPAGKFLVEHGVAPAMFNSYGSRRGNDRVMTRGTFANTRIKNELAPGTIGGLTMDFTDGTVKSIFEASNSYKAKGIPLVVLAGKDYGMGSSRDWAAKGTFLLGVKVVITESFERIHRSNLVGMGVMPLNFINGQSRDTLGLKGDESFTVHIPSNLKPRQLIKVEATRADGSTLAFDTLCRVDTPVEVEYYRNGGILNTVLRKMISASR
ncbi:MAG: aconitate hydratase AcnA [Planctomycetota bacterium]|jgi:aconitate hydratase|nr:MAG: aconitate hydratase AcnA [Planctomycetota bacterium]RLS94031.1 MAG: aconitate hydratase AcnA [Planctomycetota bacterium]